VATEKCHPFHDDFSQGNRQKSDGARPEEYGGFSSVITLFAKKFLTKIGWCAGALS